MERIPIAYINYKLLGQSRFDRVIESILDEENPERKKRMLKTGRPQSLKNRTSMLILLEGETPEDDIELTAYYLNKLTSVFLQGKKNIPFKLNKGENLTDCSSAFKFKLLVDKICSDDRYSKIASASGMISGICICLRTITFEVPTLGNLYYMYERDIHDFYTIFLKNFVKLYTESEYVIGQYDIDVRDFVKLVKDSLTYCYKSNIGIKHSSEFRGTMIYTGAFSVAGLDRLLGTAIRSKPNPLSALILGNRFLYRGELQMAYDLFSYTPEGLIDRRFAFLDTFIADLILNYDKLKAKYGKKAEVKELEMLTEQERINLAAKHINNALQGGASAAINLCYSQYEKLKTSPNFPAKEDVIQNMKMEADKQDTQYPSIYNNLYEEYKETDEELAYSYLKKGTELYEQYALYKYAEHLLIEAHYKDAQDTLEEVNSLYEGILFSSDRNDTLYTYDEETGEFSFGLISEVKNDYPYEEALDMLLKSIYQSAWTLDYTPLPLLIKYFYIDTRGTVVRLKKLKENKFPYRILINDSYINLLDMNNEEKTEYLLFARDNIKPQNEKYIKMAEELLIATGEYVEGIIVDIKDDNRFVSRNKFATYTIHLDKPVSGFDVINVTQRASTFEIGNKVKMLESSIQQSDIIAIDKDILI